jgi:hypothetical protein
MADEKAVASSREQIDRLRDVYSDSDRILRLAFEFARGKRAAFSEVLALLDSQPDTRTSVFECDKCGTSREPRNLRQVCVEHVETDTEEPT